MILGMTVQFGKVHFACGVVGYGLKNGPMQAAQKSLANGLGSYPKLQGTDGCTRETDGMPLPDCRLYAKQN